MDRGSAPLKSHMAELEKMEIRQTRRGWIQECLGCEAKSEFKYLIEGKTQIAHSLEDTDCFCRMCCAPIHPYKMEIKELNTDAEMVTVDRPCAFALGCCKCCGCDICFQKADFTSGGEKIGSIREQCYCCVPRFQLLDASDQHMYTLHQPTCCGGMCVNCCAEGNPCGKGCCKASFRVYDPSQEKTDGDAPYLSHILKKPKSLATEVFTDANAFVVTFPKEATPAQKGILMGTAIFINGIFFEGEQG